MLLNYVNYWYLNCCLCMSNFSFPGKNVIATNYVDEQKGKSFIIKTQCFDITLIDCSKNKNEKRCVMHVLKIIKQQMFICKTSTKTNKNGDDS